eukprot:Gb_17458 [translate_table: standard]
MSKGRRAFVSGAATCGLLRDYSRWIMGLLIGSLLPGVHPSLGIALVMGAHDSQRFLQGICWCGCVPQQHPTFTSMMPLWIGFLQRFFFVSSLLFAHGMCVHPCSVLGNLVGRRLMMLDMWFHGECPCF